MNVETLIITVQAATVTNVLISCFILIDHQTKASHVELFFLRNLHIYFFNNYTTTIILIQIMQRVKIFFVLLCFLFEKNLL